MELTLTTIMIIILLLATIVVVVVIFGRGLGGGEAGAGFLAKGANESAAEVGAAIDPEYIFCPQKRFQCSTDSINFSTQVDTWRACQDACTGECKCIR